MLAEDEAALPHELEALRATFPELRAEPLAPGEPARARAVRSPPGLAGIRLEAGYAVPPAAATAAFAARADAAGARLAIGEDAELAPGGIAVGGRRGRGRRRGRRGRPVDAGDRRPVRRLAADRAAVGRQRGGPPRRAAAPRGRAGRDRRADRGGRRPAAAVQHRHRGRGLVARLDVPARRARRERARAAAARERRALRPGARDDADRLGARVRAAAVRGRPAAAGPRARPRRRVRRRRPRRVGDLARAGLGPAGRRPRARPRDAAPAAFDPARFPA